MPQSCTSMIQLRPSPERISLILCLDWWARQGSNL
jgi:hypothetical protein